MMYDFIQLLSVLICFLAFSKFALSEYVVAFANMAFHISVILDFPTEHLVVARGLKYLSPPVEQKLD